jgi:DNA repair protein RadC
LSDHEVIELLLTQLIPRHDVQPMAETCWYDLAGHPGAQRRSARFG